jgi:hypothetical protein
MHSFSIRAAIIAASVVLTSMFVLPSTAALAGESCSGGSLSACVQTFNQNLYITSVQGWAYEPGDNGQYKNVHIELTGPKGLIKNCAAVTVASGGSTPRCEWTPKADEAEGSYCATAWWEKSAGDYQDMGEACEIVQPTP